MNELGDLAIWREAMWTQLGELGTSIAQFLPQLLGALLILGLGWAVARGLELIASRGLRKLGLDHFAIDVRMSEVLERAGMTLSVSQLAAKILFWIVFLAFLLSSIETLGLAMVTDALAGLIEFIPVVVGAALIAIGGLLFARLVGTLTSSAAAAAGYRTAPRIGFAARILIAVPVVVIAVERLGVHPQILMLPLMVVLATAGFGIALAFALGCRPVISHIMAGHFLKQSLPRDVLIEIEGRRGLVERVGAVETVLLSDEQRIAIPNARLLEQIVVH